MSYTWVNTSLASSNALSEQGSVQTDDHSSERLNVDGPAPQPAVGEFLDWESPRDPQNPFNWPSRNKWRITLLACFMTYVVQVNGTAMTSAWQYINDRFGVSDEHFPHSYWPMLSWNLGGAAAPMLALPLMENFGIRWSYLSVYLVLIIFLIPQALARSYATLIVTRIITGGCSGVLANITSAIVSDIWRDGRSKSFGTSLWIWSLLAGLSMGPGIGSVTLKYCSWRWIFYSEIIFYSALLPVLFVSLPEVRPDVILARRAKHIRSKTGKPVYAQAEMTHTSFSEVLRDALTRPTRMLITESIVFSFGLWSAFCIGTAFMFTQSIVQVYQSLYSWTYFGTGLVQAAIVIGELVGLAFSIFQDELYFRSAQKNSENPGAPIPEARLYLSVPTSFFGLTGGLFWYAWTSKPHLHWVLPTIGLGFVGFGMFTVVTAASNYLLDSYGKYSASAIAGCVLLENMFAALLPLATQSMYTDLGFGWASSMLGFLALGLSCIPLVLIICGESVRRRSKFMLQAMYD